MIKSQGIAEQDDQDKSNEQPTQEVDLHNTQPSANKARSEEVKFTSDMRKEEGPEVPDDPIEDRVGEDEFYKDLASVEIAFDQKEQRALQVAHKRGLLDGTCVFG